MAVMTHTTGSTAAHSCRALAACLAIAAGLALSQAAAAAAATFTVNPTQVFLSSTTRSALVTIKNETDKPARFQLSMMAWTQDPDGQMQLAATQDVVFFPSLLTLNGHEERRVRVGAEVPVGPVEKTYRLFIEELPPSESAGAPSGVVMLTKVGIPIFLQPARLTTRATLQDLGLKAGRFSFRLVNSGTFHFIPQAVRVRGLDEAGAVVLDQKPAAWYVLAGGERVFDLEIPADACARIRSLVVEAQLPDSTSKETLQSPDGACVK
jgi:fimbrial chaperone protein